MKSAALFKGKIELSAKFAPRPEISHVLFDFDGTLSLIRQGWQEVMSSMFMEMFPRRADEPEDSSRQLLDEDIMRLTGKQTIYQMIQFGERVKERGGQAREPLWYKNEYLLRLHERIRHRIDGLRNGTLDRERFLVFEARALLENLAARRLKLYLASGTDEQFVKEEAELLDITRYFDGRIYGAQDDYKKSSKKMVIERILRENQISGKQLLTFGDGYVEIGDTKQVGGLAVAVASDEAHNGSGQMCEWKRQRLVSAGADAVIPDYRDRDVLLQRIFHVTS